MYIYIHMFWSVYICMHHVIFKTVLRKPRRQGIGFLALYSAARSHPTIQAELHVPKGLGLRAEGLGIRVLGLRV